MKITYIKFIFLLFLIFLFQSTNAQKQSIKITNPSFEDFPRPGIPPRGWFDCGRIEFPNETPPDVHPLPNSVFGVNHVPIDGDTYLGMVTRETGSIESVSQSLNSELEKGKCYTFSIDLCRSDTYKSRLRGSRGSDKKLNFTKPLKLRIWGGNGYCDKGQLLGESDEVKNIMWERFTFHFSPDDEFTHIKLEAFCEEPVNGNILLDNATSIMTISCDGDVKTKKMVRSKIKTGNLDSDRKKAFQDYDARNQIEQAIEELGGVDKMIVTSGSLIKFKRNKLTLVGELKLKTVAQYMESLPNFKLVIDFNGMKIKRAKLRGVSVLEVLEKTNLTSEDYEIRNSTEEDNAVKWLVDKDDLYLGIILKTNKQ